VYRFEYFWSEFHELHQVWKSHKVFVLYLFCDVYRMELKLNTHCT